MSRMSCLTSTIVILSLITSESFFNQIKSTRSYNLFKLRLSNESPNLLKEQFGEFATGLGSIFGQSKDQLDEVKTSLKSAAVDIKDVVKSSSTTSSSSNTQSSGTESVSQKVEQQEAKIETPVISTPPAPATPKLEEPKKEELKKEEPVIAKVKVEEPVVVKAKTEVPVIPKEEKPKDEAPKVIKVSPPKIPLETFESVKSISEVKATPFENAVAVKSIPIKEASKISQEVSEESVKKAQQAILKSFESINNNKAKATINTVTAPAPAPVQAKKAKDTTTVTGPPFFTEMSPALKKTESEVAEESALGFLVGLKSLVKKETEVTPEKKAATAAQENSEKSALGFLVALKSLKKEAEVTPEKKAAPVAAVAQKKPVVAPTPAAVVTKKVAPAPTPAAPAAPQFGGVFDFLKSDPGAMAAAKTREGTTARAPPTISAVFSNAPKPAPVVSEVKKVVTAPTPVVVEKKSVSVTEEKPVSGGFFGWGASAPASAPVAKAAPVVASKDEGVKPAFATKGIKVEAKASPAPAVATKPAVTVTPVAAEKPASGGFFGWGASSSSTPTPTPKAAPASTPKAAPVVAPKVEVKTPVVVAAKPAAVAKPASSGGGLFGWGSSPAPSAKATPVVAAKDEGVKPAFATKGVKVEAKAPSAPFVATKPAVAPPAAVEKKAGGGLFGWGGSSSPAPVKVAPVVVPAKVEVKSPVVVASKSVAPAATGKSASSGGLFGWGGSSSTKPAAAPAVAPKVEVKAPVVSAKPVTVEKPASGGGGLFGWGASSSTKAAPAVTPAVASKSTPVVTAKVEVKTPIKNTPATPTPEKKSSGGLFGWGSSSSSSTPVAPKVVTPITTAVKVVAKPPVTPPVAVKPVVAPSKTVTPVSRTTVVTKQGMNATFQALVAKLLKNSQLKISDFQKSTNDFRVGSLTPKAYVTKLETLFGNENLSLIVNPLVQELPEKDLAAKLKTAFNEVGSKKK